MIKIFFEIALRNVLKNWRYSIAALLAISASFVSLVLFQGYILDLNRLLYSEYGNRNMYGDLIVENLTLVKAEGRAEPWKYLVTEAQQLKLDQIVTENPKVFTTRVRFLRLTGMASTSETSRVFMGMGYDVQEGLKMRGANWSWNTLYGKPLDRIQSDNPVLVGQLMGGAIGCVPVKKQSVYHSTSGYEPIERPFECKAGSQIQVSATTEFGQANALDLQVEGLVDAGFKDIDDKFMMMPLQSAQSLMDTKGVSFITFRLTDETTVKKAVEILRVGLGEDAKLLYVGTWKDHPLVGDFYRRTMDLLSIFRNFIVIIILLIASLSVFNTVIKIIKERTREIGSMRSLGFRNRQILYLFWMEFALLTCVGVAFGVFVSLVTTFLVNKSKILYKAGLFVEPSPFTIGFDGYAYLFAALGLVAMSGLVVALVLQTILKRTASDNLIFD